MATRQRDARGRFVKKAQTAPAETPQKRVDENDLEHQVLVEYNRIADHGREITIETVRRRELWMKRSLHALFALFLLFMAWLLVGCGTRRVVEYVPVEKKVTETVTLVDTLVEVKLVPYRDSVSVPADTASHLENPYAYSNASLSGGRLNHSLGIKPDNPLLFPIQTRIVHVQDSIPYPVPGPVQYVERSLTIVEKVLMGIGVLTLGGGLAVGVTKVKKWLKII